MAQTRQDIEGGQNKLFPVKNWHLKFKFLSITFAIFAKFSKNHVLSFLLMSSLCHINGTQVPFHF